MSGITQSPRQNQFQLRKPEWLKIPLFEAVKHINRAEDVTANLVKSEDEPLPPCSRLIVIMPESGFDLPSAHKRIWKLAVTEHLKVLLVHQPYRPEHEFRSRSQLTSLAASIRDWRVVVNTHIVFEKSIVRAVAQLIQPGDVIICFEDHFIPGFWSKERLADRLATRTNFPVYTLKGKLPQKNDQSLMTWREILIMVVSLAALIGFLALDVWIDRNSTGTFRTVVEIASVIFEVWIFTAAAKKFM
jgi:hypothetical protein